MMQRDQSSTMLQSQYSNKLVAFCKNHANQPSGFFIVQQPWIKYCKICALNAALSGRRIQKELSPQQFQRKMQINLVVYELKKTLQIQDQNNQMFKKAIAILEQASKPLQQRLLEIDQTLKQLQQSKQKLQNLYQTQIAQKASALIQRHMRISLHSRQIKTQLEAIQSNFGTIIQNQISQKFQEKVHIWNSLLEKSKKDVINQHQYAQIKEQVLKVAEIFYDQIEKLSKVNFNFPINFRSFRLTSPEDTFDMVLTPVDSNSLNTSVSLEQQLAKKPKTQLKLRSKRKVAIITNLSNQAQNLGKKSQQCIEPIELIKSIRLCYKRS